MAVKFCDTSNNIPLGKVYGYVAPLLDPGMIRWRYMNIPGKFVNCSWVAQKMVTGSYLRRRKYTLWIIDDLGIKKAGPFPG